MSGALVAQAINESVGTPGFQGIDAILKEYLGLIAEQAGTARVPISRTINGHSLASDVDLTNDDVGAAPAGFGLGTSAKTISSMDLIDGTGTYDWGDGSVSWIINHYKFNDNYAVQIAIAVNTTIRRVMRTRLKVNGTWEEWEYVNPPMIEGVEYRTTERWQGKTVYAKAVNFGALPNSNEASIQHGIINKKANIRSSIISTDTYIMLDKDDRIESFSANSTDIVIRTNSNMTSYSVTICLWYTKD